MIPTTAVAAFPGRLPPAPWTDWAETSGIFNRTQPPRCTGGALSREGGGTRSRVSLAQEWPNPSSVVVTDNGTPRLSATQRFTVTVVRPARPDIRTPGLNNGQFSFTMAGDADPDYAVRVSSNLATWSPVWTNDSPTPPFTFNVPATHSSRRFHRGLLGP